MSQKKESHNIPTNPTVSLASHKSHDVRAIIQAFKISADDRTLSLRVEACIATTVYPSSAHFIMWEGTPSMIVKFAFESGIKSTRPGPWPLRDNGGNKRTPGWMVSKSARGRGGGGWEISAYMFELLKDGIDSVESRGFACNLFHWCSFGWHFGVYKSSSHERIG